MASGGTYRIDNIEFPAPITTWDDLPIAPGLNGIPFLSSYMRHVWRFSTLESCRMDDLRSRFAAQNAANSQLTTLETDPHDASGGDDIYGTRTYTDFQVLSVSPVTRGMPEYDDVTVVFEVYVA